MDGMPEHLFEQNEKVESTILVNDPSSTFEMINFKHKQQQRERVDSTSSQDGQEKKQEEGSYLSKLAGLAEKWDGSIEDNTTGPAFCRFNSQ